MENLTHTLFGLALADMTARHDRPADERRLFLAAGAIAANLPDIDVLYTVITPAPLGYLLHHRGHTHTFAGAVPQIALFMAALALVPVVRRRWRDDRTRLWTLVTAGVLSHVLLDWTNSYGVHPFYPFDNRWYYGDMLFVIEPTFWVLLGVGAAANARTAWGRRAGLAIALLLPAVAAGVGLVPWTSLAVLAVAGTVVAILLSDRAPHARATAVVMASIAFTLVMFGASRTARAEVLASLDRFSNRTVADVILTPNPSAPVCWAVIVIEHDQRADAMRLRPGSFSMAPGWRRPETCALQQRFGPPTGLTSTDGRIAWSADHVQPLSVLRRLRADDCRGDAWLRFGRAPALSGGRIRDLRFGTAPGTGFSSMTIEEPPGALPCPRFVPPWERPREDLIGRQASGR